MGTGCHRKHALARVGPGRSRALRGDRAGRACRLPAQDGPLPTTPTPRAWGGPWGRP